MLTLNGIRLPEAPDEIWELHLSGRRVWSFRPSDEAVRGTRSDPGWRVPWPRDLGQFLDGVADLRLYAPGHVEVAAEHVRFGASAEPILLLDAAGHPLAVDRTGRLVRTFEARAAEQLDPLMDALETVIDALTACGVQAFPAYGTLLGAVRSGKVIGHDNDADVGYVSSHTAPVDVVRESFALQRELHRLGFEIARYSGGAFKVTVDTGAEGGIGLDVFAGFFHKGHLVLMGEIYDPFEESWMLPLGEVELEGRRFPAPAQPERLLEIMYGPSWRVPDPTFTFSTSEAIRRRLNGWFRGTRTFRNNWDRRYSTSGGHGPLTKGPHDLARALHKRQEGPTYVLDIGCGRGQDAVWLARQGHRVVGLDYSGRGFAFMQRRAHAEGWDATFHEVNLLESRQALPFAARAALEPGPRAVLARHVIDSTTERGRQSFWRMTRTVLGDGGRLYLDFMASGPPDKPVDYADALVGDLDPDLLATEAVEAGGSVLVHRFRWVEDYELPSQPVPGSPRPRACRMVVEWAS